MPLESYKSIATLICYNSSDENLQYRLLNLLNKEELIGGITSFPIDEGDDSAIVNLEKQIPFIKIVLLLISPAFLEHSFSNGPQMKLLINKHKSGILHLIPVILRPVNWQNSPLSELQALPRDNRPLIMWPSMQKAWLDIIKSIRLICEELQVPIVMSSSIRQLSLPFDEKEHSRLNEVFVTIGSPNITFVKPEDFQSLINALLKPGHGIILEGPSGAGKTTAWKKAVEQLPAKTVLKPIKEYHSIEDEERFELAKLKELHRGTIVIDDFHKLGDHLRKKIIIYLKRLADEKSTSKKLIIVGIPETGQTLIDNIADLVTRVDVFEFGHVSDDSVQELIEIGETALNIKFDRKAEIINAANGSLFIAQSLCHYFCSEAKIYETQSETIAVHCDIVAAKSQMMKSFSYRFGMLVRKFAAMDGPKSTTCLELLQLLAYSENGALSLDLLKETKRHLRRGIKTFLTKGWIYDFFREDPKSKNLFFFNKINNTLIIDNPLLAFYLKELHYTDLAKELGKVARQKKVFICYSHKDREWYERLQTHLVPLEREGVIELWDDTKIVAGTDWKEEIQNALEAATVAVILVSPNLLASKFIMEFELPKLLLRAENEGTYIIPLVIAPCLLVNSELNKFTYFNPYFRNRDEIRTLSQMQKWEKDKIFSQLAEAIKTELISQSDYF
jgi:adenylate kinase